MFQAYLIRCLTTGRGYVGITSRPLRRRWSEHLYDARQPGAKRMAISRAIAKHGAVNFVIEPLCCAKSWDDICAVEPSLIEQHSTRAPIGYNVAKGGEGPFGVKRTPEAVERSAAKHRGKPCHPNTIAAAHARRSIPKPDGHGAKVSAAKKGKPRSATTKAKIAAYWAARRAAGGFKTSVAYAHAKIPLPLSRHIAASYRP